MKYEGTMFDRNIGVWSEDFQDRLRDTCVGIAGVGGASHAAIDILLRNGVGHFKLADPDVFEIHNLQRQSLATRQDLGKNKAEAIQAYIHSVDPEVSVTIYTEGLTDGNLHDFLNDVDYVIEAIDISALHAKLSLHKEARAQGITIMTAPILAAGAGLLVFQPDGVCFEEYFDFPRNKTFSPRRLAALLPSYLQSFFFARMEQGSVPTTCDGAYLTGVMLAGTIKRLLWGMPVPPAPTMLQWDMLDDRLYQRVQFPMFLTPLFPCEDDIYLKLEGENPTGSMKYRLAQHLLEAPLQRGEIHSGMTVIEASSGNTGVALAMLAQKHGCHAEIYVTPDAPPALLTQIQNYQGKTHTFAGSPMELAGLLQKRVEEEGCYWPNQYTNPEAIRSYDSLWQELRNQLDEAGIQNVDYFVAALGTGGSLMGLGPAFQEHFQAKVIAVESDIDDPIPGIRNADHQYLGPIDLYKKDIPTQRLFLTHSDAQAELEKLQTHSIKASASTGACLAAAHQVRKPGEVVVILAADAHFNAMF